MVCEPNDLAYLARCFSCLPESTLLEIQAYLLCQIVENGGGGGVTVYSNPGAGVGSEEFGLGANADGVDSSAFGSDASAAGVEGTAFGSNTNAAGAGAVALGAFASAIPAEAIAVGGHTTAGSLGSVALGPAAVVGIGSDFGVAIGDAAHVDDNHDNSVAIGTEATTDDSNQIMLGTALYDVKIPGSLTIDGRINGVKKYVALLTQIGANAPTAAVMENTMGGTVTYARSDIGQYTATLAGVFIGAKTFVIIASIGDGETTGSCVSKRVNDNTLSIETGFSGARADDMLAETGFEIRVYP